MSTNNEKLYTTLVDLLRNFENRINTINAKYKVAAQVFHNAQLATHFAEQEYSEIEKNISTKETIIKKAIECSQASKNVLTTITQLKACCSETVTQAATNASHIQRANHGVLLVTSDMGSINSILQASDIESDLAFLAQQVFKKIEEVAMLSEEASQLSMEIAAHTAEVAAPTLLDKITYSDSLLNSLLKKLTGSQQSAKEERVNKEHILAETKNNEALAEGNFENLNALKISFDDTYALTNGTLNQQLQVKVGETDLVISFDTIQAPFKEEKTEQISANAIYPVKEYFLFFVKHDKKAMFDLRYAESIVANEKADQYIQINQKLAGKTIKIDKKSITCTINSGNLKYKDSEGHAIETNTNYVIFLMAEYEEKYQRYLGQFSGYLSAPSLPFSVIKKATDNKKSKALSKQLNSVIQENKTDIDLLETTLNDLNNKLVWTQNTQLRTRTYGSSILDYRNNLLKIIEAVNDLNNNEQIIRVEVSGANAQIKELTKIVDLLLKKLLFAIDVINKLSNTIMRKKAVNPLISDDLVRSMSIITENSSLVIDVSMLVLQHTVSTLSSSNELTSISKLTQLQLQVYYQLLTDEKKKQMSLSYLINREQNETQQQEQQLIKDLNLLQIQIEKTNEELSKARAKYQSNELAQLAIKQI
ncbi:MAG: hypothetical protein V4620_00260 [Bacteroidota bacterium]